MVLLMADPQLAQMLRDAANMRLAVSVPALAAPAFLAGLYGDRVQSVFLVRDRLLAVIDVVIQENDPLAGQTVRKRWRINYRLVPVAVIPSKGAPANESMPVTLDGGRSARRHRRAAGPGALSATTATRNRTRRIMKTRRRR